jgi:DNA-binding PadR family transcriptional regulator
MVVLEQKEEEGKEVRKKNNAEGQALQRFAKKSGRCMGRAKRLALTMPDLVLLSLLAERPMHGYQANLELERREIRDWANLSRPQVYYSLEKLASAGLLRTTEANEPAGGPERSTFETTAKGRAALANALELGGWTEERDRPPFMTWMALSWQARPGIFEKQLERRREFLEKEIAREREVLDSILKEVGHPHHEAVWMVSLMIEQFEAERKWLLRVQQEAKLRSPAKNPEYAEG